jgi:hypothetical protein
VNPKSDGRLSTSGRNLLSVEQRSRGGIAAYLVDRQTHESVMTDQTERRLGDLLTDLRLLFQEQSALLDLPCLVADENEYLADQRELRIKGCCRRTRYDAGWDRPDLSAFSSQRKVGSGIVKKASAGQGRPSRCF